MSVVDRLKMHADLAVYGQQVVTVGLTDLRALLVLVRARIRVERTNPEDELLWDDANEAYRNALYEITGDLE